MSREDGSLNPLFSIGKGQLVELYDFATFEDDEDLDELDEEALTKVLQEAEEFDKKKPVYLPNGKIVMA